MKPTSETELAQMVAGLTGAVRITGGGTRGIAGSGQVIETCGMTGITLYEPGALTLVAQAGTPLAEVEAALDAEGQQLAFEPMDHRSLLGTQGEPTIGGVVAANISGPRRIQAGACRDFLLGVRYVDGTGQVIKNGGRVMKNVTGYDLVKLICGSWGTLGVLTEVSLKVLPKPEHTATLSVTVSNAEAAIKTLSAALRSPFEVTGAAYDPECEKAFVRVEGFAGSVAYRTERLTSELSGFGQIANVDEPATLWTATRDVHAFRGKAGDVWRLSVTPGDAPMIAARAEAEQVFYDWGGGLIWLRLPAGTDLRARLGTFSGHATLVRGDAETVERLGRFQPESVAIQALIKGIRAKFDPRGLFNPGLMG